MLAVKYRREKTGQCIESKVEAVSNMFNVQLVYERRLAKSSRRQIIVHLHFTGASSDKSARVTYKYPTEKRRYLT